MRYAGYLADLMWSWFGLQGKPAWVDPDDAAELTEAFFEDAEIYRGDTFVRRGRRCPPTGDAKELVSIRLDPDVLAKLREAGPGWQARVNALLRTGLG